MKKMYRVVIHYEGAWHFKIEARDEDDAREKAEQMFDDISDSELIANLADIFIDGCWELKE